MRRAALYILDRLIVALMAAAIILFVLAVVEPWKQPSVPVSLDSARTQVIVKYEDGNGHIIAPAEVMPLWEYVEVERGGKDSDLREAIENDLHAHDPNMKFTHMEIDGKRW